MFAVGKGAQVVTAFHAHLA